MGEGDQEVLANGGNCWPDNSAINRMSSTLSSLVPFSSHVYATLLSLSTSTPRFAQKLTDSSSRTHQSSGDGPACRSRDLQETVTPSYGLNMLPYMTSNRSPS